jgi:tape measure domain-containing protein
MELRIRITGDGKSAKAEIVGVDAAARKLGDAGQEAGRKMNAGFSAARQGVQSISQQLASLQRVIYGVAASWVSLQSGKMFLEQVATIQDLNTRLKYLTGSAREFGETQAWLSDLAQRQHKDYRDLASAYSGLLALQKDGNVTQEESRRIMEGLSNAASVMGASNAQLQQVFYGLQQSLSASTINMEDFRQVVDPLPGLFGKVARAAGMTTAEFKNQVAQGEVTGEMFRKDLIAALEDYNGAAEGTAANVHAKYADIQNAWTKLVETLEQPVTNVVTPVLDAITRGVAALNAELNKTRLEKLNDQLADARDDFQSAWFRLTRNNAGARIARTEELIRRETRNLESSRFTGTANIDTGGASLAMLERRAQAVKKLSEQEKHLVRDRVENLKASGQLAAAYQLEATKLLGMSDAQAKQHVQEKLATDAAKDSEKTRHKSATAAEKLSDKLTDLTTKYQDELNILGLTDREAEIYKARHDAMAAGARDAGNAAAAMAAQIYDAKKALEEEGRVAETVANAFKSAKLDQDIANATLSELQRLQGQGLTGDALKKAFDERKTYIETQFKAMYDGMDKTAADALAQMVTNTKHTDNEIGDVLDKSADQFTETWKNAVKRLDDVFANFWKGLLSGSGDFMGSLKSLLTDFAAEALHNIFTRPLTNLFSGGGTQAGAPTGAFSLVGNLLGFGTGITSSLGSGLAPGALGNGIFMMPGGGVADLSGALGGAGAGSGGGLLESLANAVGLGGLFAGGFSPYSTTLGLMGIKAGNFLGLGSAGSSALGLGLGYSPWGVLGGLAASMLGINGGLPGMALGALGSVAGGALGGGVGGTIAGLSAGSVLGPIGAILGALGGSFIGSLFGSKPKTPKASASGSLSATNLMQLTSAWAKNGGNLAAMISGVNTLTGSLAEIEEAFDVEFGRVGATMGSKGKKGIFSVSVLGKSFSSGIYKIKNQAYIQAMFENMKMWALRTAIDQIDDPALKVSIQKRRRVKEVMEDKQAIENIRLFTGEASELKGTLEELAQTFKKMRGTAAFLNMDMTKLHDAWTRAMVAQRDALRTTTLEMLGEEADPEIAKRDRERAARLQYRQIGDFNAALVEESSDATRNLGALLTDLDRLIPKRTSRSNEVQVAQLSAIRKDVLAMQAMDLSKSGAGDQFNAMALKIGEAFGKIDGKWQRKMLDHLTEFTKALHAGEISLLDDTVNRYTEVQFLEKAIAQQQKERYAFELDAVQRIKDYAESLLLSDLTTLSPEEQFRKAQGDYGTALLKAQALDKESLANLPSLADQYLRQAKGYYASSTDYATIFDAVVNALKSMNVPGFASGGMTGPGWALVGEQGPELVNFRDPARVYTSDQTRAALSGNNDAAAAAVERLTRVQQEGNRRIIERLNAMDGRLQGLESSARMEALAA